MFRVAFYGKKFPPEIANQEFVYRGAPLEQIIDFSSRIKNKYPGVQTLDLKTVPGPEHKEQSETYFMALSKLAPSTRPEVSACHTYTSRRSPLVRSFGCSFIQLHIYDSCQLPLMVIC